MSETSKIENVSTKGNYLVWIKRAALSLGGGVFALVAGAFIFQLIASSLERSKIELPGIYVSVNGHNLYVNCQGPTEASVIMLENGLGVVSENWDWVQQGLASKYRVCAYDRAGIGNSDPISSDIDAVSISDEFVSLLDALDVNEPVLVVGHSYGALIARVQANRHPDKIAGLVLVDSSHQDMAERFPPVAQEGFDKMLGGFKVLTMLNKFSGARAMGVAKTFSVGLEGDAYDRAYHHYATTAHMAGSAQEAEGWDRSTIAARKITSLGGTPLTVMMVDGWSEEVMDAWRPMQEELSMLSTKGKLVTIKGADHFGAINDSKHAAQVVQEIEAMATVVFD